MVLDLGNICDIRDKCIIYLFDMNKGLKFIK